MKKPTEKDRSQVPQQEVKMQIVRTIELLLALNSSILIRDEHSLLLQARARFQKLHFVMDTLEIKALHDLQIFLNEYVIMHQGLRVIPSQSGSPY